MSAPVFVGDFEPGSPEWHAARAHGIGGSEIAAVLGLSPWESRFSLWHRKKGLAAPVAQNDVMYWGTLLEDVIRGEFNRRHADNLPPAKPIGTWHAPGRPWQIANPDGRLGDELYEGKTAFNDDGWGEPGTDEIPVYYRTQCLWYLDVFGLKRCHVAVLISGSDYREYYVEHSPDEVRVMLDGARDFLDTLDTNQRPDIDAHDATYQVVREMHPDIEDVRLDVPEDIAEPFLVANQDYKLAVAAKKQATATLADFMGSARRAYYLGEQIAMRVPNGDKPPYVRADSAHKQPGLKVSAA